MIRSTLSFLLLLSILLTNACLQDRDNPYDPEAPGDPGFSLRHGDDLIVKGSEFFVEDPLVGNYTDTQFYIYNTGDAYLVLTGMQITTSSVFSVTKYAVTPVKPGYSTDFIVRFTPAAQVESSVEITVKYFDAEGDELKFNFTLTGTGI